MDDTVIEVGVAAAQAVAVAKGCAEAGAAEQERRGTCVPLFAAMGAPHTHVGRWVVCDGEKAPCQMTGAGLTVWCAV